MSDDLPLGDRKWGKATIGTTSDGRLLTEWAVDAEREFLLIAPMDGTEEARGAAQALYDRLKPTIPGRRIVARSDFDFIVHPSGAS